ncbi:hypothetical protein B0H14DRAFT_3534856 [Mycena olivaceomarginata]|nr:hypothetical protein B0H14DRAFT_3534856 [Mycena olivaceomarginata]
MYMLRKLFTLVLCAFSTVDTQCGGLFNSQDGTPSNVGITIDDSEMVKVVNVGASGSVFAFPAGDVLVEKGNTGQDTFGILEKIVLEKIYTPSKAVRLGFYIVAASDGDPPKPGWKIGTPPLTTMAAAAIPNHHAPYAVSASPAFAARPCPSPTPAPASTAAAGPPASAPPRPSCPALCANPFHPTSTQLRHPPPMRSRMHPVPPPPVSASALGLPPMTVATAQRQLSNRCRSRPVGKFSYLPTAC